MAVALKTTTESIRFPLALDKRALLAEVTRPYLMLIAAA